MTHVHFPEPSSIPAERRGRYGELLCLPAPHSVSAVMDRFRPAMPETYCEFDRKGRGDAVNVDLYGYDPVQDVAVVQARHAFRQYRNGYLNIRKTYFLCGFNEITEAPFRHSISAAAIHAAIRRGADAAGVVRAAAKWMWQVDDRRLETGIRQGDVLLVPERRRPIGVLEELGTTTVVGGSHEVAAARIVRDKKGMVWADSPTIRHTKEQHDTVYGDRDGWHTVRVAREADAWNFAARLGD